MYFCKKNKQMSILGTDVTLFEEWNSSFSETILRCLDIRFNINFCLILQNSKCNLFFCFCGDKCKRWENFCLNIKHNIPRSNFIHSILFWNIISLPSSYFRSQKPVVADNLFRIFMLIAFCILVRQP